MVEEVERNKEIVRMARRGLTYKEIGDWFGISKARVHAIVSKAGIVKRRQRRHRVHDLRKVLRFIVDFKREHDGNSPTLREIGAGCGISSTSVVVHLLKRLEKIGKIEISGDNEARSIVVVGGKWTFEPAIKMDADR